MSCKTCDDNKCRGRYLDHHESGCRYCGCKKSRDSFYDESKQSKVFRGRPVDLTKTKLILEIDAALIAGLLILLSLYPFKIVINQCDIQESFASSNRAFYGFLVGFAFVLFSSSAIIAFRTIFENRPLQTRSYFMIKKKSILSDYLPVTLTATGFAVLLSFAFSVTLAMYFDIMLPQIAGCHYSFSLTEPIALSDNIRSG